MMLLLLHTQVFINFVTFIRKLLALPPINTNPKGRMLDNNAKKPYYKSQPLYLRYKSILPTSLTHIVLRN